MFKRIAVGVDGSALSGSIIPFVDTLAASIHAELALIHVIDIPDEAMSQAQRHLLPDFLDREEKRGREYVQGLEQTVKASGVPVRGRVVFGDPATEILESAGRLRSDVIALATHGRSGFHRWAHRSVTQTLLHITTTPLLLIPGSEQPATPPAMDEIVVPLDGSSYAASVLPLAESLARSLGVPIVLLRAVEKPYVLRATAPDTAEDDAELSRTMREGIEAYLDQVALELRRRENMADAPRREAEAYLAPLAAGLRHAGLTVGIETPFGHPAAAIEEYASAHPDSLIVMVTHGRTGVPEALLESVAQRVVERTGGPILVVPPAAIANFVK